MLLQIVLLLLFIGLRRCRTVKAKEVSLLGCFDLFLFTWLCQWKVIISMFIHFGKMRGSLKSADCRRRLKWRPVRKLRERHVCMPTPSFINTELSWWRQGINVFGYTSELTPKWERRVTFAVLEDMEDFVNTLASPSPKHRLKNPLW